MKVTRENAERLSVLEKIANGIMWWVGSVPSLVVHTVLFLTAFLLPAFGLVNFDKMLLTLTTILSLEAIYLAIFIQMSVNKSSEHIEVLREDVTEIQEDIEDIQEDIEEISEDIEDISDDIDEIQEDIEDIAEDDEEEDPTERAKNVMLKSNVSTNKSAIKSLRDKIQELENQIENLRSEE
ncbi:DUF1003 domain-containing protein [Chryseobacterium sp. MFBS3-17]|uniref:DUF1003 domain-containing protein n=1 Tax=Chryseobacterium sp. MFBS3-17 TaxID=2886689 RepID=UPI001D0E2E89|nr:DUF1003 domain-containing protein [Chryseobacterium sp. MFBS3-17]MCC2590068.1 hypothetical protein [Chryseobacterium sp. MFBS3-17]